MLCNAIRGCCEFKDPVHADKDQVCFKALSRLKGFDFGALALYITSTTSPRGHLQNYFADKQSN